MIEARGLTKRYGRTLAVNDLTFAVRPRMVTALLGANGSGKSTAIHLMVQLERGRGTTLFAGRRYRSLRHPAREIGVSLGPAAPHPARRVRQHLRMLAAASGIRKVRVDEVLELTGLTPVAGMRGRLLSDGTLSRLALAGALLGDPHTLILDEPAAGLDTEGLRWLREFLRAFAAEGRTVLVAGHGLAEIANAADRVLVMARGNIVADQPVADFVRNNSGLSVRVRTPQIGRLIELLRAEGAQVAEVAPAELVIQGADRARIGEIAFRGGVLLHELTRAEPTLGAAVGAFQTRRRAEAQEALERAAREREAAAARKAAERAARGRWGLRRRGASVVADAEATQHEATQHETAPHEAQHEPTPYGAAQYDAAQYDAAPHDAAPRESALHEALTRPAVPVAGGLAEDAAAPATDGRMSPDGFRPALDDTVVLDPVLPDGVAPADPAATPGPVEGQPAERAGGFADAAPVPGDEPEPVAASGPVAAAATKRSASPRRRFVRTPWTARRSSGEPDFPSKSGDPGGTPARAGRRSGSKGASAPDSSPSMTDEVNA